MHVFLGAHHRKNEDRHIQSAYVCEWLVSDSMKPYLHYGCVLRCVAREIETIGVSIRLSLASRHPMQRAAVMEIVLVRGMRILARFLGAGWHWVRQCVQNDGIQPFLWIFLRKFQKSMCTLLYRICSPSSAFQWSQNAWPWITLSSYFTLNSGFPVCVRLPYEMLIF